MEIELSSFQVKKYNENINSDWLRVNLDLFEKYMKCDAMKMASYH